MQARSGSAGVGSIARGLGAPAGGRSALRECGAARRSVGGGQAMRPRSRDLERSLQAAFLLLLLPAALGRLTGWRFRPWPPGPQGYGSIVGEARTAAATYVPLAFMGL